MQPRTDSLDALTTLLPREHHDRLRELNHEDKLVEVVLDLGRRPRARYIDHEEDISTEEVTASQLAHIVERLSFGDDNRAGISGTLHRIAALRNRAGTVVGLSCRIGRSVIGTSAVLESWVRSGKSVLVVGAPGRGKTTLLRDIARVLADEDRRRVMIVDTSNEIAGDGDAPHPAIGSARRMQVARSAQQHACMIEAVENHMPEVIVIDEIGNELEAAAARTIAERGVQLIATAHGRTLKNVLMNPTLADLVGGVESVTLGDDEAFRRGTTKTVLERRAPPTFDICVEIDDWQSFVIHEDVAGTVDRLLLGQPATAERRWRDETGTVRRERIETAPVAEADAIGHRPLAVLGGAEARAGLAVLAIDISPRRMTGAIESAGSRARLVHEIEQADVVIAKGSSRRKARRIFEQIDRRSIPVYTVRTDSQRECGNALRRATDEHARRKAA